MSADIYGRNPTTTKGEYFRANNTTWKPILAISEKKKWDIGKGVSSQEECDKLANNIDFFLNNELTDDFWDNMGTQSYIDADGTFHDNPTEGTCNIYKMDLERIKEFVEFLRCCGGFYVYI